MSQDSLDWDVFRVILAVANSGSLSAAGRQLDIDPATVGRRLARAEAVLGAKLFNRLNNGLFPTKAGETAISYADRISRNVDEVNNKLLGADQHLAGTIRVSIPHNLMQFGLAQDIADFRDTYPEIEFRIETSDSLANFSNRTVDVVIRAENQPTSGLWGYQLTSVNYSFAASEAFLEKWQNQMADDPENVPLPYVALSTSDPAGDEQQLLSMFPNAQKVIVCNGLDSVIPLVAASVGTARIARFMLPTYPGLRKIMDCEDTWNRLLWVLTHPDLRDSRRIRLFMEFLRDRFKEREKTQKSHLPVAQEK